MLGLYKATTQKTPRRGKTYVAQGNALGTGNRNNAALKGRDNFGNNPLIPGCYIIRLILPIARENQNPPLLIRFLEHTSILIH